MLSGLPRFFEDGWQAFKASFCVYANDTDSINNHMNYVFLFIIG